MLPVTHKIKAKEFYLQLGFQVIVELPMRNGENLLEMELPNQTISIALINFHKIICKTTIEKNTVIKSKRNSDRKG